MDARAKRKRTSQDTPSASASSLATMAPTNEAVKSESTSRNATPFGSASTVPTNTVCPTLPERGNNYKIVDMESKKAITLVSGNLSLVLNPDAGDDGGWKWRYEEANGWVTFREAVSGCYLAGRSHGFMVKSIPEDSNNFVLRPQVAGYNLGVLCEITIAYDSVIQVLKPMGISNENGSTPQLVVAKNFEEATKWVFFKV
ncbi:hypothetical protein F4808DRAFT_463799 [Astrocystis sublimbata]|nr:hypothetical protein F4808DRAFT_463799 [Astrocystis sublimbata]